MRIKTTANRQVLASLAIGLFCLSLAGCAGTTRTARQAPTETRDANGFTITETKNVGFRVRSDFEDANRAIENGNLDGGIEKLVAVTEKEPDFSAAHINLAIAYQQTGDLGSAEASLLKAIDANPRHPVAHNELGIVYRRTGRFEKARASYESALALQPSFHFAQKNLAVLCDLYLQDLSCALDNYRRYLEADPENESAEIWVADLENRLAAEGN